MSLAAEMNNNDIRVLVKEEGGEGVEGERRSGRAMTDVLRLLQLKDDPIQSLHSSSEQLSHASSLESLQPCQGSQVASSSSSRSESPSSGSTTCSESSFEMASSCSFSEEELQQHTQPQELPTSLSLDCLDAATLRRTYPVRESIEKELSQLDSGLPKLDFVKLEQTLSAAAQEQERLEKSRLGEEVRRRLALQADAFSDADCQVVSKRPLRSNLGQRLQAAMHLQVCYMNELSEESETERNEKGEEEEEEEEEDDDLGPCMRVSKSVPDLAAAAARARSLRRDAASGRQLSAQERQDLLRAETLAVQAAANVEGRRAAEELRTERRKRPARKPFSRQMLSRMTSGHIAEILEGIEDSIEATNVQLVSVLQVRDSLHMERDSLLVDVGDLVEGASTANLHLPTLIRLQDTSPQVPHDLSTPT